jgi:hypothetical protein
MLLECGNMSLSRITLVTIKTVGGVFFVELKHETVASDFGDDRCGSDGEAAGVTFDDGVLR